MSYFIFQSYDFMNLDSREIVSKDFFYFLGACY